MISVKLHEVAERIDVRNGYRYRVSIHVVVNIVSIGALCLAIHRVRNKADRYIGILHTGQNIDNLGGKERISALESSTDISITECLCLFKRPNGDGLIDNVVPCACIVHHFKRENTVVVGDDRHCGRHMHTVRCVTGSDPTKNIAFRIMIFGVTTGFLSSRFNHLDEFIHCPFVFSYEIVDIAD